MDIKFTFGPIIGKKIELAGENYTVCAMECSRYVYDVKTYLYFAAKRRVKEREIISLLDVSNTSDYKKLLELGKHALYATAAGFCPMHKLRSYIRQTRDDNDVSWCKEEMKKIILNFYEENRKSAKRMSSEEFALINLDK